MTERRTPSTGWPTMTAAGCWPHQCAPTSALPRPPTRPEALEVQQVHRLRAPPHQLQHHQHCQRCARQDGGGHRNWVLRPALHGRHQHAQLIRRQHMLLRGPIPTGTRCRWLTSHGGESALRIFLPTRCGFCCVRCRMHVLLSGLPNPCWHQRGQEPWQKSGPK